MATSASLFEGITLEIGTITPLGAPASETWKTIGEVTDFSGPGGEAAVIDATHNASTARDKLMGLPDEGQFTATVNLIPGDTGQDAVIADRTARTKRNVRLTLADTSTTTVDFVAFPIGFSIASSQDDKVTANLTFEITGAVTYT